MAYKRQTLVEPQVQAQQDAVKSGSEPGPGNGGQCLKPPALSEASGAVDPCPVFIVTPPLRGCQQAGIQSGNHRVIEPLLRLLGNLFEIIFGRERAGALLRQDRDPVTSSGDASSSAVIRTNNP